MAMGQPHPFSSSSDAKLCGHPCIKVSRESYSSNTELNRKQLVHCTTCGYGLDLKDWLAVKTGEVYEKPDVA